MLIVLFQEHLMILYYFRLMERLLDQMAADVVE